MRDELMDVLDAAAKRFPIKKLAADINKAESSLRNELTQQHGYKLGLWDAVLIMKKTRDLSALDMIEDFFRRVAFPLPDAQITNVAPIMRLMADLSKEFGESVESLADALRDGRVEQREAQKCLKEVGELIRKGIELEAHLKHCLESHG